MNERPEWKDAFLRWLKTVESDPNAMIERDGAAAPDIPPRASDFQRVNLWSGPCATMACPTTPLTSACPGRRSGSSALCGGGWLLSHKKAFRKPAKRG